MDTPPSLILWLSLLQRVCLILVLIIVRILFVRYMFGCNKHDQKTAAPAVSVEMQTTGTKGTKGTVSPTLERDVVVANGKDIADV